MFCSAKKTSILLVALFLCTQSTVLLPDASGHATIVKTDPPNGQQIQTPPSEVVLHYSEGVEIADISVLDSENNKVSLAPEIDGVDNSIVRVPIHELGDGVYTVNWHVLSVDGHTTNDSFFFIIGDEVPSRGVFLEIYSAKETAYDVGLEEPILRWLVLSSLVVLVGLPASIMLIALPRIRHAIFTAKRKLLKKIFISSVVIISVSVTLLAIKQMSSIYATVDLETLSSFVSTTLGVSWLVRLAASLGLLATLLVSKSWKAWCAAAIGAGIVIQATVGMTSHSASMIAGGIPFFTDFFHLVASSLWVGGVFALAVVILPSIRSLAMTPQEQIELIKKFSILAIASITVLAVTGLSMTFWHVGDVEFMFSTTYGIVLSIKISLLSVAIGIGTLNRFLVPRLFTKASPERAVMIFSKFIKIELIVLFSVLLMSGILTSIQTASTEFSDGTDLEETFSATEYADGVAATLLITPKQVGLNVFDLYLTRDDLPLTGIGDPKILLTLPSQSVQLPQFGLNEIEPGLYSAFGTFTYSDEWDVRFSGIVDGKFTTVRFQVDLASEPHELHHGDHDIGEEPSAYSFDRLLWLLALVILAIAAAILSYELSDLSKNRRSLKTSM